MNKQVTLSADTSFATIAEAAMLAQLPQAYREDLRTQIVAFTKWLKSISGLEERCEQLELDLKAREGDEEQ